VRRALPWVVGALGGVLLLAGVVVFAVANSAEFGWTAYTASYAPLEPAVDAGPVGVTFSEGAVLWSPQHALGAGLAVLGLLVLVGLGGWVLGRRSRRPEESAG
jgi:hypothetical protein